MIEVSLAEIAIACMFESDSLRRQLPQLSDDPTSYAPSQGGALTVEVSATLTTVDAIQHAFALLFGVISDSYIYIRTL